MKAVLFDGHDIHTVDDLEVRPPGHGEIAIRVCASGLCQSDLSVVKGTIGYPVPVVLGHEGAGVVEQVGPGVTGLRVGDHVVTSTLAGCGRCPHCASGHPTLCRSSFGTRETPFTWKGQPVHNFAALSTFAERIVVKSVQAIAIPPEIPLTSACLIGCGVLTGAGAVFHRARVQPGDRVAVIGIGGVGLNVVQASRISGATTIVAVDMNTDKLEQAKRFGATHFVDASGAGTVETIHSIVEHGVDHVFDCVGVPATLREAFEMAGWGGQVVVLGVPPGGTEYTVPAGTLYLNRSLLGCRYGSSQPAADIPRYVEMYRSGQLKLDELVTRTYTFEDFPRLLDDARNARLDRGVLTF